jgi:hypothetical protein
MQIDSDLATTACSYKASFFFRQGKYDGAISIIDKVIEIDSNSSDLWYGKG